LKALPSVVKYFNAAIVLKYKLRCDESTLAISGKFVFSHKALPVAK
jgi:hypothetical protein